MSDPYLIPGTVVLQNKLGISDFDELEQAVADIGDDDVLGLIRV
jgi:hypothetical protein